MLGAAGHVLVAVPESEVAVQELKLVGEECLEWLAVIDVEVVDAGVAARFAEWADWAASSAAAGAAMLSSSAMQTSHGQCSPAASCAGWYGSPRRNRAAARFRRLPRRCASRSRRPAR